MAYADKWITEMWYGYTIEYQSTVKKSSIMNFAGNLMMKLEHIILNEVTQTQKDKRMFSLILNPILNIEM